MLLLISFMYAYRLLKIKLKENDDLYVTNVDGVLRLRPPNLKDFGNQTVVVSHRKLFFVKEDVMFTLFLHPHSLEIKVRQDKRRVGALKRPNIGGGHRTDPFGFLKKKKAPSPGLSPKDVLKNRKLEDNKYLDEPKEQTKRERIERPAADRRYIQTQEPTNEWKPSMKKETSKMELKNNKLAEIENDPSTLNAIESDNQEVVDQKENPVESKNDIKGLLEKVKSLLDSRKQKREVETKDTEHLIESDSKIEDYFVKYQKVDVFVNSIDKTYFKLKTEQNDCVTYLNESFIFTPCINIENQIFKMEREDDVKAKYRSKKIKNGKDEQDNDQYDTSGENFSEKDKKPIRKKNDTFEEYNTSNNRSRENSIFKYNRNIKKRFEQSSDMDKGFNDIDDDIFKDDFPKQSLYNKKKTNLLEPTKQTVKMDFKLPYKSPPSFTMTQQNSIQRPLPPQPFRNITPPQTQKSIPHQINSIRQPTSQNKRSNSPISDIGTAKNFSPDDFIEKLKSSLDDASLKDILM